MNANTNAAPANSIENGEGAENAEKVDRDIPSLTTKKKKNNITRLVVVGAMLVALIVVATGCAMFMKRLETQKQQRIAEKAKERPKESAPGSKDFESAKKRIKQEEDAKLPPPASALAVNAAANPAGAAPGGAGAAAAAGTPQGAAASGAAGAGAGGGQPGGQAAGTGAAPVVTPAQRRLSGDVLVDFGAGAAQPAAAGHGIPAGRDGGTAPKNGFDEKLKPSLLVAGVAAQRPDLSMLLRRGTTIPCGQYTYIKTSNPGAATCIISKDIYSANGDVLLVERGSTVFGEVRDGLSQGQDSIPVLWSRIDTTRGVTVDINSLGTDALGASGVPVSVDNHLMQRFGGAVMLSLISDFGQALSNRASDGQGTVRLTTTSTAGQDLATKTLENTINIPPTGYSPNGAVINILLLRDMDFRSVYELARY